MFYYVPIDIRNELMQYVEQYDDPSDSDGEGVTHEDQEPTCDPPPQQKHENTEWSQAPHPIPCK